MSNRNLPPTEPRLVLPAMGFAALGMFSLGLACVVLLVRPDVLTGDPIRGPVLALTHLITLGWIGPMLFTGAYLLAPVLAETSLWSVKTPAWHLAFHVSGLALLIGGLWAVNYQLAGAGAILLCAGLALIIVNVQMTGNKRSLWTASNIAFQSSMFWLAVTGSIALYMLRNRAVGGAPVSSETLIALHAHYALFGFLTQALLGASLRMTPRLLGQEDFVEGHQKFAWAGWTFLNVGLLLLLPSTLAGSFPALLITGICIALGVAGFAAEVVHMLWRARRSINWGSLTHATGVLLLLGIAIGVLSRFPQVTLGKSEGIRAWMQLYISLVLLGPFVFVVLGSGERLVPLIVWKLRYGPWATHAEVPPPATLGREAAGGPVYFALLLAWIYLAMGQIQALPDAVRVGAILLLIAFAWFFGSIGPALVRFLLGVTPRELGKLNSP
ncbi:MAG: hypothetical protein IAE94_14240 [Chthoniobacterales bacterium]|nr:hypothetical protein [Chthoniobacterales bacterium]